MNDENGMKLMSYIWGNVCVRSWAEFNTVLMPISDVNEKYYPIYFS